MRLYRDQGDGRMTMNTRIEPRGLRHYALFYRCQQDYLDAVVPFVLDGLNGGEPVLVAVPENNLCVLRDALADVRDEVTLADLTDVGRNPGRILGVESAFAADHEGLPVRIVGEPVWPGRSAEEYAACVQHEALVNMAFAGREATVLCPYDAEGLGAGVVAEARTTHPLVWNDGPPHHSAEYAPDEALTRHNQPLPGSPTAVDYAVRTPGDLQHARSLAARYARGLGLPPKLVADLQLIVTELATNSLEHGGGACRLAFWRHDGHVVCEAADSGRLDDPLAGRLPAAPGRPRGRGLFLVNAMADLVRTHVTDAGTTIQAYLRLGSSTGVMA